MQDKGYFFAPDYDDKLFAVCCNRKNQDIKPNSTDTSGVGRLG